MSSGANLYIRRARGSTEPIDRFDLPRWLHKRDRDGPGCIKRGPERDRNSDHGPPELQPRSSERIAVRDPSRRAIVLVDTRIVSSA